MERIRFWLPFDQTSSVTIEVPAINTEYALTKLLEAGFCAELMPHYFVFVGAPPLHLVG